MRPSRSCLLPLLVLPVAACTRGPPPPLTVPASKAPPPLRLEFRPPVDSALIETATSSVRRDGAEGVQEAELTTVSRFTREEQGTWLLTQRVRQARSTQGGLPVKTPVDELLTRVPLRVRLAADGTFVRVPEPGAFLSVLRAGKPEGRQWTALERFFAPELVEARARREWEVKYGKLSGRALVPGRHTYGVDTVSLGGREVTYLLERTFTGTLLTEHGEAAVFTLRCLGEPGEEAPAEVGEALEAAGEVTLTPGVECEGEQLLGRGRFLPVRRGLTLRAPVDGETWTWAVRSALESAQPLEEEQP
jgi:hypothetical protein